MPQTFTLTFGDQAENHVGMEKLGQPIENGFDLAQLSRIQAHFDCKGFPTQLHCLNELFPENDPRRENTDAAYVLVVRNGLKCILSEDEKKENTYTVDNFFEEQLALRKDDKAKMYGRVVNKHARHNLCFADQGHPANYEQGQGTVVSFADVPVLARVREAIRQLTGHQLVAEGNYYYDTQVCGIGYHGDSERRVVVGIRVGEQFPLHFRWYHRGEVVSTTLKLYLENGDMYFMSDKAVGWDWKSRSLFTLRHAAGASKYLDEATDF